MQVNLYSLNDIYNTLAIYFSGYTSFLSCSFCLKVNIKKIETPCLCDLLSLRTGGILMGEWNSRVLFPLGA
jgi:hypothetical protein